MLGKITLLQLASMFSAFIGPTTQNPPLVRSFKIDVGPATVLRLLNLECNSWTNVNTPTITFANYSNHCPTLAQRLLQSGYFFQ